MVQGMTPTLVGLYERGIESLVPAGWHDTFHHPFRSAVRVVKFSSRLDRGIGGLQASSLLLGLLGTEGVERAARGHEHGC